ncbi:hypothetical protein KIPB_008192, partial [Kipferlia bialata]
EGGDVVRVEPMRGTVVASKKIEARRSFLTSALSHVLGVW